jgi:hypothetical protein
MTTPSQPPPAKVEEQETGAVLRLTRLFLLQLLAVAAITALLTTFSVLIGRGSLTDRQVSSVVQDPPSASAPATVPTTAAPPTTAPPAAPPPAAAPPASAPPASAPPTPSQSVDPARPEVVVLNQSVAGPAAKDAADRLRRAGWKVARTDDFSGTVRRTTVYYPSGEERAARQVAKVLPGKTRILPRFSTLSDTRVTVVLTGD